MGWPPAYFEVTIAHPGSGRTPWTYETTSATRVADDFAAGRCGPLVLDVWAVGVRPVKYVGGGMTIFLRPGGPAVIVVRDDCNTYYARASGWERQSAGQLAFVDEGGRRDLYDIRDTISVESAERALVQWLRSGVKTSELVWP